MEREALAQALVSLGCPAAKSGEMAVQLDKRAGQLVAERGWTREQALVHLLGLMRQGWAAQARGHPPFPIPIPGPIRTPASNPTRVSPS